MKYYANKIGDGNIAVDDTILVKGVETTAGSKILEGFKPLFSAEAVTRLEDKGYAISVVVEALTGALAGSAFSKDTGSIFSMEKGQNLGHFFMALDVSLFATPEEFKERMNEFCQAIKSSGLAVGSKGVFLPGEMEHEKVKKHAEEGFFRIPKEYVNDLNELAKEIGADMELGV